MITEIKWQKVLEFIEAGHSIYEASKKFNISPPTIRGKLRERMEYTVPPLDNQFWANRRPGISIYDRPQDNERDFYPLEKQYPGYPRPRTLNDMFWYRLHHIEQEFGTIPAFDEENIHLDDQMAGLLLHYLDRFQQRRQIFERQYSDLRSRLFAARRGY